MDDLNRFVPDVTFEKIPIKNLVSNQNYQRNLSQLHIERAAENFDPFQINPVKVSRRNGINYVFNGQHTIEIVARVSGSRETPVWCMVYDNLSYEHEADIFANQQKFVKALLPYEVFMANLEAGNDEQLIIRDLVESYGLTIGNKPDNGCIRAVATLESVFRKYGYHVLDRVLRVAVATWEGDPLSFAANILNAMAKLFVVYDEAIEDEIFKEKLGVYSVKALTRLAKDRRAGSMGFAEAMVILYNGKKKKNGERRLSLNKLYARENNLFIDIDTDEDEDEAVDEDEDMNGSEEYELENDETQFE